MDPDVRRWLDALRAERGFSSETLRAYTTDLGLLVGFLEARGRTPRAARLADLRAWLASGRSEDGAAWSPATLSRRVAAVRGFYLWLVREGVLSASPAERLRSPKVPKTVPRFLEVPEAAVVVEDPAQEGRLKLRNQALLELMYGAGLRVSEAVGVDLGDLDLDGRMVRVRGKGGKDRVIPFGPPAVEAIRAWLAVGPDEGAVFRNRDGGRLSARAAWQIVRDAGAKNGLPGLHPHVLRHTCATHLLAGGADLRGIQEQLGHATLSTTQRYTHVDAAHLLQVYRSAHPRARRRYPGDGDEDAGG